MRHRANIGRRQKVSAGLVFCRVGEFLPRLENNLLPAPGHLDWASAETES